jgi:hypothetical protein
MMERFLERVSVSSYKHNFILKGGMLITAMVGLDIRTTMDMDIVIKGRTLTAHEIIAIIEDILRVQIDDGVEFALGNIEEIREEAIYPGFRVSIGAILDKTRQTLKIDITTGDFVTPSEIEYPFKMMFDNRTINIMAYNLETVLSEKLETIIVRGITNTRMRDFYDIYILTTTQAFDTDTFKLALRKTIEKRGTAEQMLDITETIRLIADSAFLVDLWHKYQKKHIYAAGISWDMVITALANLQSRITA